MSKVDLDDYESLRDLDRSSMLDALDHFPDSFSREDYDVGRVRTLVKSSIRNLVIMGMGGSASSGDVVSDWLRGKMEIPVAVLRESNLPGFVDSRTMFVGLSYSGETIETLKAVNAAKLRGAKIIGIGTGGKLENLCETFQSPFVRVRSSIAPRAALSHLIVATILVLERAGIVDSTSIELRQAGSELTCVKEMCKVEIPLKKNLAKKIASNLLGQFIVLYAMERMSSVARRFKNQLAENAKEVAKYDLLPESSHNEAEAWTDAPPNSKPVIIRDSKESSFEQSFIEAFRSTIASASKTKPIEVRTTAQGSLSRLLCPILLLDYVSVYLALLKRIDPTPTKQIMKYKKAMSSANLR